MIVGDLMQTDIVAVPPHMSWRDAAALLYDRRLASAPVVDAEGRLVGILSEKDLFRGLFPRYGDWTETPELFLDFEEMENQSTEAIGRSVADVMSRRLVTAERATPVLKVGALMVASGIHHVPVVDEEKLVGMVGRGDIYRAILRHHFGIAK